MKMAVVLFHRERGESGISKVDGGEGVWLGLNLSSLSTSLHAYMTRVQTLALSASLPFLGTQVFAAGESHGVVPAADALFDIGPLPVTNSMVTSWVVAALLIILIRIAVGRPKLVPSRGQSVVESLVEGVMDLTSPIVGSKVARDVPAAGRIVHLHFDPELERAVPWSWDGQDFRSGSQCVAGLCSSGQCRHEQHDRVGVGVVHCVDLLRLPVCGAESHHPRHLRQQGEQE